MTKFKKIFLILFLASFLLFIFSSFIFAQKTELEYPQVNGAQTPTTVKTAFPEYIKYLFNLSIIIAGLIAFASLVYGGFRYLTSVGDPMAMGDAKDRIIAGLLGLAILLASFIILTTINPQLVNLKIAPEQFQKGVILYAGACQGANPTTGEEGKDFLRVRRSLSSLENFNGKTQSIYFFNSSDELEVYIYPNENWKPEDSPSWKSIDHEANKCYPVSASGDTKSIILYWKTPGVYLFEKTNFETPPSPRLYTADSGDFGDFHDKAKSLKILSFTKAFCIAGTDGPPGCKSSNPKEVEKMCNDSHCLCPPNCGGMGDPTVSKFGVILHENSNFEGDCQIFFKDEPDLSNAPCTNSGTGPYCQENVRDRASAITLFKQLLRGTPSGDGVTLYNNYDFNEEEGATDLNEECHFSLSNNQPLVVDSSMCSVLNNQKASSIKVDGTYIALLFRDDGRCEVFKSPGDLRLKDNNIGDDKAKYMLVIPVAKD